MYPKLNTTTISIKKGANCAWDRNVLMWNIVSPYKLCIDQMGEI